MASKGANHWMLVVSFFLSLMKKGQRLSAHAGPHYWIAGFFHVLVEVKEYLLTVLDRRGCFFCF